MDISIEQITALIYRAVDEINEELDDADKLARDPDTVLFGRDASIDSMTLVTFIVIVEEQLMDEFGLAVTLADEKAMSMERSPFRTLATLIDYVKGVTEGA